MSDSVVFHRGLRTRKAPEQLQAGVGHTESQGGVMKPATALALAPPPQSEPTFTSFWRPEEKNWAHFEPMVLKAV